MRSLIGVKRMFKIISTASNQYSPILTRKQLFSKLGDLLINLKNNFPYDT